MSQKLWTMKYKTNPTCRGVASGEDGLMPTCRGVALGEAGTNPTCRGVASGEDGLNPTCRAVASGEAGTMPIPEQSAGKSLWNIRIIIVEFSLIEDFVFTRQ